MLVVSSEEEEYPGDRIQEFYFRHVCIIISSIKILSISGASVYQGCLPTD
jgi:hypothetical protein